VTSPTDPTGRRSALRRSVALWVAFVVLAVLGVITVLLPELQDDSAAEDDGEGQPSVQAAP